MVFVSCCRFSSSLSILFFQSWCAFGDLTLPLGFSLREAEEVGEVARARRFRTRNFLPSSAQSTNEVTARINIKSESGSVAVWRIECRNGRHTTPTWSSSVAPMETERALLVKRPRLKMDFSEERHPMALNMSANTNAVNVPVIPGSSEFPDSKPSIYVNEDENINRGEKKLTNKNKANKGGESTI